MTRDYRTNWTLPALPLGPAIKQEAEKPRDAIAEFERGDKCAGRTDADEWRAFWDRVDLEALIAHIGGVLKLLFDRNIKAAAYDPADRVLSIQFANSAMRFDYQDVAPDVGAAFLAAESKGRFLATQIMPRYHFEKVDTASDEDNDEIVTTTGAKVDLRAPWPMPDKARA